MSNANLPHNHGQSTAQVWDKAPGEAAFEEAAILLRQLSDGGRLRLFWLLCHCEECVINLAALMGMSSPALSHHLRQLRSAGLIVSRRDGKEVYYKAADTPQVHLLHHLTEDLFSMGCPHPAEGGCQGQTGGQPSPGEGART